MAPLLSQRTRFSALVPFLSALVAAPGVVAHGQKATSEPLVAQAPIWGANNGEKGYAFLPVTIHGHTGTVMINLNDEGDLKLSTAALAKIGVTAPTTPTLDSMTIGTSVQREIPLTLIQRPDWSIPNPDSLPTVVGIVGVHFMNERYDLLYDFPNRRVQLYAWPATATAKQKNAWLPAKMKPADCGPMVNIPPGAATFTGMTVTLDGKPVTGVIEMMPYGDEVTHDEKMNQGAFDALQLPANSPRIEPLPGGQSFEWHGKPVDKQVTGVHIAIGKNAFWTGPVKLFPILDVEAGLPPNTSVMLLNLVTIRKHVLFNSVSSKRVCISE